MGVEVLVHRLEAVGHEVREETEKVQRGDAPVLEVFAEENNPAEGFRRFSLEIRVCVTDLEEAFGEEAGEKAAEIVAKVKDLFTVEESEEHKAYCFNYSVPETLEKIEEVATEYVPPYSTPACEITAGDTGGDYPSIALIYRYYG